MSAHRHTDACYDGDLSLMCGREETPRTVRDVLVDARLACYVFTASDGHPAIRVRDDGDAADAALAALHLPVEMTVEELREKVDSLRRRAVPSDT